jgi:hypothetical protein
MKINLAVIFLISFGLISDSLALEQPLSLTSDKFTAEDRELFLFFNNGCSRKLDACRAAVGDDGLPVEQWLNETNQISGEENSLFKEQLLDLIGHVQTFELDYEMESSITLDLRGSLRVLRAVAKLREVRSIDLPNEDGDMAADDVVAAASSILDVVSDALDVLGPRRGNFLHDFLFSLLEIKKDVLVMVLVAIVHLGDSIQLIPIVGAILLKIYLAIVYFPAIFMLVLLVVIINLQQSLAKSCSSELMKCNFEKLVRDTVPSFLDIASEFV